MRRLATVLLVLAASPILFLAGALAIANTPIGAGLIERLVLRASGGAVRIEGLHGRFPDAIRVARLSVADDAGDWLTAGGLVLTWSPLTLVLGQVSVERLTADTVTVDRLPASSGGGSGGFALPPIPIAIARLGVARLTAGPAIAGTEALLSIEGTGHGRPGGALAVHLAATAPRPGRDDRYLLDASFDGGRLHASLDVLEGERGLIATLSGLPDVGGVAMTMAADGPMEAVHTGAEVEAGPLKAEVHGTLDLPAGGMDLALSLAAPAMAPGPGVAWGAITGDATLTGPFRSPDARGTLAIDAMNLDGAGFNRLRASLSGRANADLSLHGQIDGLHIPGPNPDLLAAAPLTVEATLRPAAPDMPLRFSLRHPLVSADGDVTGSKGGIRLSLPDIGPLAAAGGLDLKGTGAVAIGAAWPGRTIDLTASGTIAVTGGSRPIQALVGDHGAFSAAASVAGDDVTVSRLAFSGRAVDADASGQWMADRLGAAWTLTVTDLGAIRPGAAGTLQATGRASGPASALAVTAELSGQVVGAAGRLEQFQAHADLAGLPGAPSGHVTAGGLAFGAPVDVAITADRSDHGLHVAIDRAAWKSLSAAGTLDLAAGDALPSGAITIDMTRLADLSDVIGGPIAGGLHLTARGSAASLRLEGEGRGIDMPAVFSVREARVDATVSDPIGALSTDAALTLDDWAAGGLHGTGRLTVKGPVEAVALTLAATAAPKAGPAARVDAAATLNGGARSLALTAAKLDWRGESVRLLAPAKIGFANGISLDGLRLGFRRAELTMTGGWDGGRELHAQGTVRNLPADAVSLVAPGQAIDGTFGADVRLSGDPANLSGTMRITADGIRGRAGPGAALPAAGGALTVGLDQGAAKLDGKVSAGSSSLTVSGVVPVNPVRPMDLRIGGMFDLAMLNPLTRAGGRSVEGRLDVALRLDGGIAAPRARGTIALTGGDFQDSNLGTHIGDLHGSAILDGDTVRLSELRGKAGAGSLALSGTLGLTGSHPADLALKAVEARLFSTDPLTAIADADLTLRGSLTATPLIAGTVRTREVDIQVPERLPAGIAVLPVRDAGAPPPPAAPPAGGPMPDIALAVGLHAADRIYVRGKGIDAELAGDVAFTGSVAHPVPRGGLRLRRGTVSLAGQVLTLTEGTIDFSAGALTAPSLHLVASATTGTTTATLTVTGEVGNPKIVLSSVPEMPQDEILAQLLFHTASARLTPLQLVQIAGALAELSGHGSPLGHPLDRVRSVLGLDQLSVGSDATGGATLQAGRYLAPGVRVVASQGASGESKATVQIDLGKGLKLETSVATGTTAATDTGGGGGGTSVGVTYQFEY
jgi:translocation and assembly module TamB